ncbi:MAG TPA: hypothetical protein VKN74_06200 [Candidatus Mcinerneyibacterium sp.]|nr:hypothetical protein [Candidatus Mcinerneyibacterium sp.]
MIILKKTINFLILILILTSCRTQNYINIKVKEKANLKIKGKVIILPFYIEGKGISQLKNVTNRFYNNIKNNIDKVEFTKSFPLPENKLLDISKKIINKSDFDYQKFKKSNIKYILTSKIFFSEELYSEYGRGDSLNPDYSADRSGDPEILEPPTLWKRRALEDLSLVLDMKIFIYDVDKKKVIYEKNFKKNRIIEDYKDKNIYSAKIYLFNLLSQKLSSEFLKEFYDYNKNVRRIYLK